MVQTAARSRRARAHETWSDDTAPLATEVRLRLGAQLRDLYAALAGEALPPRIRELATQLEEALSGRDASARDGFRDELLAALPALRGFAISLADPAQADDLVQETLLKAWQNQDRYRPGTHCKAWLFTILRNLFYSQCRKGKRETPDVDGALAEQMIALPNQEHSATLKTVFRHFRKLSPVQREALILVGAQGLTYEAASEILGCEIGTVKSRVSRGRAMLTASLGLDAEPARAIGTNG